MDTHPDQRMTLAEARRRLRPLLADPDDPLFPGSVDAYSPPPADAPDQAGERSGVTGSGGGPPVGPYSPPGGMNGGSSGTSSGMAAPGRPPAPSAPASSGRWTTHTGATPLSTQPGPLPAPPRQPQRPSAPPHSPSGGFPARPRPSWQPAAPGVPNRPPMSRPAPPPPRPQASLTARWALPLALVGALAVLAGATVGWVSTRVLVGQSPWATTVSSPASGGTIQLKPHVDSTQRYGNSALGFTASVPNGWEEYRLVGDNEVMSVRYVSLDGSRELRFDKTPGTRSRPAQPAEFVSGLTPTALGVTNVTVEANAGTEVRYRTDVAGARGTVSRVTYAHLAQAGNDLWVVRLTVPANRAGNSTQQLFNSVVNGFRP
jgi:hypothetical protein